MKALRFIGGIVLTIALLTAMGLSLVACLWMLLPKGTDQPDESTDVA